MNKILKSIFLFLIISIIFFRKIIIYETSIFYCKLNSIATTGEIVQCHYDFINKLSKNLAEKYINSRDECLLKTDNQYELGICSDMIMKGKNYVEIK